MKKLMNISNQIKSNTYSYTGKGSFEAVVNNNKEIILNWLEELEPLQKQIDQLSQIANVDFQKRNYTRILTKIMPDEYQEFVSVNILVRDSNIIAQYYNDEFNLTLLYDMLVKNKYLKYPGKYERYVEYHIFQRFVMMYKDDLSTSLECEHQTSIKSTHEKLKNENETIDIFSKPELNEIEEEIIVEKDPIIMIQNDHEDIAIIDLPQESKDEELIVTPAKEKTNWTQLLLGRGK